MTARELYEANATDHPHIGWDALNAREQEGWEYAARLTDQTPTGHTLTDAERDAIVAAATERPGNLNPVFAAVESILAARGGSSTDNEALLVAAGFEKRYLLCGHPAYPDPLDIHPPTEENAARIWRDYCSSSFEEYVAKLGHTPRRLAGDPYTAETWNPRVLITWRYVGQREVFVPTKEPS